MSSVEEQEIGRAMTEAEAGERAQDGVKVEAAVPDEAPPMPTPDPMKNGTTTSHENLQPYLPNPNFATRVTDPGVLEATEEMFTYKPWDEGQKAKGDLVRKALLRAVRTIIDNVPPGPDRSVAIRKLRECRMDCNSGITHRGWF